MKKLFLPILMLTIVAVQLKAQVPQLINYQTIVRNSSGQLVKDKAVGFKFEVLKNSANGQVAYSEKHTITTNQFGIVNLKIGSGTVLSGTFKDIDWGTGKSFLKMHLDLAGGSNYTEMGVTEIVSVPYALHAGSVYVHYSNDTLYIGDQWIYLPGGGGTNNNGSTVADYDGNTYGLVTIGTQTFISSNLKSTHYSDGSAIAELYDYDNNASNSAIYGKLYPWDAAMNGASTSNSTPSGVQGICPTGFHLPSQEEWSTLIDYVKDTYGGSKGIRLQESGTAHWETATGTNETGFTALGVGYKFGTGENIDFQGVKEGVSYWSSTEHASNADKGCVLRLYDSGSVLAEPSTVVDKVLNALPVRCIKD